MLFRWWRPVICYGVLSQFSLFWKIVSYVVLSNCIVVITVLNAMHSLGLKRNLLVISVL